MDHLQRQFQPRLMCLGPLFVILRLRKNLNLSLDEVQEGDNQQAISSGPSLEEGELRDAPEVATQSEVVPSAGPSTHDDAHLSSQPGTTKDPSSIPGPSEEGAVEVEASGSRRIGGNAKCPEEDVGQTSAAPHKKKARKGSKEHHEDTDAPLIKADTASKGGAKGASGKRTVSFTENVPPKKKRWAKRTTVEGSKVTFCKSKNIYRGVFRWTDMELRNQRVPRSKEKEQWSPPRDKSMKDVEFCQGAVFFLQEAE